MRNKLGNGVWASRVLAFVAALGAAAGLKADVTNGDFTAGYTGFTTSYNKYTGPTGTSSTFGPGNYAVDTTPIKYNPNFGFGFGDHTTGTGLMMIFDGATSSNVTAWSETVAVTPNTTYRFSYWTAAWGNDNHNGIDPFPPSLTATANGSTIGAPIAVPAQDGTWTNFSGTFNSGSSSSATLAITDTVTNLPGNDFVLDDITLNPTPEPGSAIALAGFRAARHAAIAKQAA